MSQPQGELSLWPWLCQQGTGYTLSLISGSLLSSAGAGDKATDGGLTPNPHMTTTRSSRWGVSTSLLAEGANSRWMKEGWLFYMKTVLCLINFLFTVLKKPILLWSKLTLQDREQFICFSQFTFFERNLQFTKCVPRTFTSIFSINITSMLPSGRNCLSL